MSQQFGGGTTNPAPDDEQRKESSGPPPDHPFHGLSEAQIQHRLGETSTQSAGDDGDDEGDPVDTWESWEAAWQDLEAAVGVHRCEVLSSTQVQLLADVHGLATPTEDDHPDALEPVYTDAEILRGFVLAGHKPIVSVPDVNDDVATVTWDRRDDDPEDGDANG